MVGIANQKHMALTHQASARPHTKESLCCSYTDTDIAFFENGW